MMGLDPDQALPRNRISKAMDRLVGDYATYRKVESLKVVRRSGLLYMKSEDSETPLIPDDPAYESLRFHTSRDGLRSPVEFRAREDGGVDLVVDRFVYHKAS